ncbi:lactonase family protein [Stieleria marina]|uniref:6-phosphogluconolactonase n=1 Tax=Stieleria marina TaxID=1930275 RepID=A0A517NNK5_9BACT|nr:6-phosphogluconolactonase [Planctomycetes bacterium K23_9]
MKKLILIGCMCLFVSGATAQEKSLASPEAELRQRIDSLIEDLNGKRFAQRRSSEQQLLRLGASAIGPMREALEQSEGEARVRLQRILTELSRSIRIVDKVTSDSLQSVTSLTIDQHGHFLYASAFAANTVSVYEINPENGTLSTIENVTDKKDLAGAVSIRLSSAAPLAVAACYAGKTVTLFSRSEITGKLKKLDVYRGDARSPQPNFPIEAVFSPDGKHVLCLDPYAKDGKNVGAVLVFRVVDGRKLQWVHSLTGKGSCLANVRGIVFHPTKNEMYLCAADAGALIRASCDPDSGAIVIQQVLRDSEKGVQGLSGVFAADISQDGKFIYTSSGRFGGDSAVGVFTLGPNGDLEVVQEMISGREKMGDFRGGNELVISPDGKNVYVTGTLSSTLAGFARDSQTGKLTFIETVPFGAKKLGPAGVAVSPRGDYVYAAVEGASSIAIFRRDQ